MFSKSAFFSDEEIGALRHAFDSACCDLGIDVSDAHALGRERVAALVMQHARQGMLEPDVIRALVVAQYKALRHPPIVPLAKR